MRWIEIITLRSSEAISRGFLDELMAGIAENDSSIDAKNHLQETKIYHNCPVETDVSIHIYWESETGDQHKSPLALMIHSALTGMGLLSHSVWIEYTGEGEESMKPTKSEAKEKVEALEARVREWGTDLKKFRARAAKANGKARKKLEEDAAILRSKLDDAMVRLAEMKKSGDAASAELMRGVGKARADLGKAIRSAKAKLE